MRIWPERLDSALRPVLVDKVERDHRQSDAEFLRRRIVVGVTLVVGATLLGVSLNVPPGSQWFYPLTIALATLYFRHVTFFDDQPGASINELGLLLKWGWSLN